MVRLGRSTEPVSLVLRSEERPPVLHAFLYFLAVGMLAWFAIFSFIVGTRLSHVE